MPEVYKGLNNMRIFWRSRAGSQHEW